MRFWIGLAIVLSAGAALFLAPARVVYGGPEVRLLGDSDPHYHVLRAERMLLGPPGTAWRDPALDSPNGADVPWPPLFDLANAGAARLWGATTRDDVARAAAPVPVLIGLAFILTVALAGRAIVGPQAGLAAAAMVAVAPAVARYALVGRIDQHVAEILWAAIIASSFARGLRSDRLDRMAVGGLAVATTLSFWTWMGSAVSLFAPAITVALARVANLNEIAYRAGRTLAFAASAAAFALAVSIWLCGPAGALAQTSVLGVTGLHAAIVTGVAGFSWILAWRSRRPARPPWRVVEVVAALGVPAVVLFVAWPGLLDGVRRGLVALAAANPWYADIREFNPALLGGVRPVWREGGAILGSLGLIPAMAWLGIAPSVEVARSDPGKRPLLFFLWVWVGTTFLFALARNRFFPYFAAPGAMAAATGAIWLSRRLVARFGSPHAPWLPLAAVMSAGCLLPASGTLLTLAKGEERVPETWIEAARWLRSAPPARDGRATVAAQWSLGHVIQYYGDRPVIASPFGTEAGPRALPDWTRFLFAVDERDAESVLLARRASHLVLGNPSHELVGLRGFLPPAEAAPLVVARSVWFGESVQATERYGRLVVSRLYFADGASPDGTSIESLRLLFEGSSTRPRHPLLEERQKIFGLVAGARLRVRGLSPGATAHASTRVLTNTGRWFPWSSRRVAPADGVVEFRVPYATGRNGLTLAGACEVRSGSERGVTAISENAVEFGSVIELTLGAAARGHR